MNVINLFAMRMSRISLVVRISKLSCMLVLGLLAVAPAGLDASATPRYGLEPAPESRHLPPLSPKVNDLATLLNSNYRADLNSRLTHFAEKSGYAIHVLLLPGDYQQSLIGIAASRFDLNTLETSASAGTVLVIIATGDFRAEIVTNKNLRATLSRSHLETRIQKIMLRHVKKPEQAIEHVVNAVLVAIDPWFYVLPSPAPNVPAVFSRFPMAEMIVVPLAPFVGLMIGIILMAFTAAGNLSWLTRFFLSGSLACFLLVVIVFVIRQPGGIIPGMFYYGAIMRFLVAGLVGALKTLWFTQTFKGKTSAAWWAGPVYFRHG
jgi:uncharacterized membrane protein YgcG